MFKDVNVTVQESSQSWKVASLQKCRRHEPLQRQQRRPANKRQEAGWTKKEEKHWIKVNRWGDSECLADDRRRSRRLVVATFLQKELGGKLLRDMLSDKLSRRLKQLTSCRQSPRRWSRSTEMMEVMFMYHIRAPMFFFRACRNDKGHFIGLRSSVPLSC